MRLERVAYAAAQERRRVPEQVPEVCQRHVGEATGLQVTILRIFMGPDGQMVQVSVRREE